MQEAKEKSLKKLCSKLFDWRCYTCDFLHYLFCCLQSFCRFGKDMAVRKTKKVRHSRGGSKKNGRMYARGSRVGVARVKNGVLHIVAPPNVSVLKPPKPREK